MVYLYDNALLNKFKNRYSKLPVIESTSEQLIEKIEAEDFEKKFPCIRIKRIPKNWLEGGINRAMTHIPLVVAKNMGLSNVARGLQISLEYEIEIIS